MDRSYLLGHIQCVSRPALHLRRHSGYLVAQSVGSRHVGGAALVGRRRNVGERWFWTGALRGRSPCTREGRRPDRPKTSSEEWENTFARLIQGGGAVTSESGSERGREYADAGRRGETRGGFETKGAVQMPGIRTDYPVFATSKTAVLQSRSLWVGSTCRSMLQIRFFRLQRCAAASFETTLKSSSECAAAPIHERYL